MKYRLNTYRTKETICPYCAKMLGAATGIGNHGSPRPGSISVCIDCRKWSVFTQGMTLRKILIDEVQELIREGTDGFKGIFVATWAMAKKAKATDESCGLEIGDSMFVWPCGCIIEFLDFANYIACSKECGVYKSVMEAFEKSGKPMHVIYDRSKIH